MTEPLSVVFMGSPDFALPTLRLLHDDPRFAVKLVVTQPDRPKGRGRKLLPPPVKEAALAMGLPVRQPLKAGDPEFVAELADIAPHYLVVVAYGQILPQPLLDVPSVAPVNLHASLLPRWRGAAPIQRAVMAGDRITGVAAMLMEKGLDTGDVLATWKTAIDEGETAGDLEKRLAENGAPLMAEALADLAAGKINPQKQPEEGVTYAYKITAADTPVDWNMSAFMVRRLILGLAPSPGATASVAGHKVKLLRATAAEGTGRPGEVLTAGKEGLVVACGEGAVALTLIQPVGKKPMDARSFLNGYRVGPGEVFTG